MYRRAQPANNIINIGIWSIIHVLWHSLHAEAGFLPESRNESLFLVWDLTYWYKNNWVRTAVVRENLEWNNTILLFVVSTLAVPCENLKKRIQNDRITALVCKSHGKYYWRCVEKSIFTLIFTNIVCIIAAVDLPGYDMDENLNPGGILGQIPG